MAQRRAAQRVDGARGHPSTLPSPGDPGSAEQIAAVIGQIDQRGALSGSTTVAERPTELARRIAAVADFLGRRIAGDYTVDEYGFDAHLNEAVLLPVLRVLFTSWFRVEVSGIDNLPETGPALVVANHAGVVPLDALMASVAVHDHHRTHRDLRLLAADLVFDTPIVGQAARKAGHIRACIADAQRLLAAGELTAVFPEGFKGLGKNFKDRYKLQRFGRGGFVATALRTRAPIVPCSIIGSEETYPMIANAAPLARLLGLPYFPITPLFPLTGGLGLIPMPSKWHIAFGTPIPTAAYHASAADDPMINFDLTDQVRETIQQTLHHLLTHRHNTFRG
jgi:1-acyl-sn-glycerol-3-phosphate acyltransferase